MLSMPGVGTYSKYLLSSSTLKHESMANRQRKAFRIDLPIIYKYQMWRYIYGLANSYKGEKEVVLVSLIIN